MLRRFPIDYELVAQALWEAVQVATGLDGNSVMLAEAEDPTANRPALPYCTYKIVTPSMMYADDATYPTVDEQTGEKGFYYAGPRSMSVAFDFYGRSHLEAYSLGCALQAGFQQDPTNEPLNTRNIAVWRCGDVVDLSVVLSTGFEGRSHVDCMFGLTAISDTVLQPVESVGVASVITDDSLVEHTFDLTAITEGGP